MCCGACQLNDPASATVSHVPHSGVRLSCGEHDQICKVTVSAVTYIQEVCVCVQEAQNRWDPLWKWSARRCTEGQSGGDCLQIPWGIEPVIFLTAKWNWCSFNQAWQEGILKLSDLSEQHGQLLQLLYLIEVELYVERRATESLNPLSPAHTATLLQCTSTWIASWIKCNQITVYFRGHVTTRADTGNKPSVLSDPFSWPASCIDRMT